MSFLNDPLLDPFAPPRPAPRPDGADPAVGIGAGGGNVNLAAPVPFLISERGQMVSHLWVAGGRIFDPYTRGINQASGWAEVGAVPKVAAGVPGGCDGRRLAEGIGPFAAGHLELASPNPFQFVGDFSIAVVYIGTATGSTDILACGPSGPSAGFRGPIGNSGAFLRTWPGPFTVTVGPSLVDVVNVACVGRAGTTLLAALNGSAPGSTPGATVVQDTTDLALIAAGGAAFDKTIYEIWASLLTPSAALFAAIAAEVKGRLGVTAW